MRHFLLVMIALATTAFKAEATTPARVKAWKIHNRLVGSPPVINGSYNTLMQMESLIDGGRPEEAVNIAMANPNFYNVVLKNWIKPWTNRDQTSRVDLNDYVATVLGVIKDDVPFTELFHGDILYTINYNNPDNTPSVYSYTSNDHYRNAEQRGINIAANLMRQTQSMLTGLPADAVAGVITTRAFGDAFFSAGTNRRPNRFLFMNYLCKDYEELHDVSVTDIRVGRDVERDPGGDSRTYRNKCVGCHAGQDGLRGAYAYYDFTNGRLNYTPGTVVNKMNRNVYFRDYYQTTDDTWINFWATGQNSSLGWRGPSSGRGAKSIGQMFSRSQAFSLCMATKVFKLVCMKDPVVDKDVALVKTLAAKFEASEYKMKDLIRNTSVGCIVNEEN